MKNFPTWYKTNFPHIPFWLPTILLFLSVGLITIQLVYKIEQEGIITNLSTELAGILFTILFVDYFIKKHTVKEWEPLEKDIATMLSGNIAVIRLNLFAYSGSNMKFGEIDDKFEDYVIEHASDFFEKITGPGHKSFNDVMTNINIGLQNIINIASIQPNPQLLISLIRIHNSIFALLAFTPDIIPQKNPEVQKAFRSSYARNIKTIAQEMKKVVIFIRKYNVEI